MKQGGKLYLKKKKKKKQENARNAILSRISVNQWRISKNRE